MALRRIRLISWFVLLCLIVLIGAQMLPATASNLTSTETPNMAKPFALDPVLLGVGRIGTGEKARPLIPIVPPCAQTVCTQVSLAPPLLERAVTAVPHSHALRVHQRISVYRI